MQAGHSRMDMLEGNGAAFASSDGLQGIEMGEDGGRTAVQALVQSVSQTACRRRMAAYALTIQLVFRKHKERRQQNEKQKQTAGIQLIQAVGRGMKTRLQSVQRRCILLQLWRRRNAAEVLQRAIRVFLARRATTRRRAIVKIEKQLEELRGGKVAKIVRAVVRDACSRRKVGCTFTIQRAFVKYRQAKERQQRRERRQRAASLLLIQAVGRGMRPRRVLGRRRALIRRRQRRLNAVEVLQKAVRVFLARRVRARRAAAVEKAIEYNETLMRNAAKILGYLTGFFVRKRGRLRLRQQAIERHIERLRRLDFMHCVKQVQAAWRSCVIRRRTRRRLEARRVIRMKELHQEEEKYVVVLQAAYRGMRERRYKKTLWRRKRLIDLYLDDRPEEREMAACRTLQSWRHMVRAKVFVDQLRKARRLAFEGQEVMSLHKAAWCIQACWSHYAAKLRSPIWKLQAAVEAKRAAEDVALAPPRPKGRKLRALVCRIQRLWRRKLARMAAVRNNAAHRASHHYVLPSFSYQSCVSHAEHRAAASSPAYLKYGDYGSTHSGDSVGRWVGGAYRGISKAARVIQHWHRQLVYRFSDRPLIRLHLAYRTVLFSKEASRRCAIQRYFVASFAVLSKKFITELKYRAFVAQVSRKMNRRRLCIEQRCELSNREVVARRKISRLRGLFVCNVIFDRHFTPSVTVEVYLPQRYGRLLLRKSFLMASCADRMKAVYLQGVDRVVRPEIYHVVGSAPLVVEQRRTTPALLQPHHRAAASIPRGPAAVPERIVWSTTPDDEAVADPASLDVCLLGSADLGGGCPGNALETTTTTRRSRPKAASLAVEDPRPPADSEHFWSVVRRGTPCLFNGEEQTDLPRQAGAQGPPYSDIPVNDHRNPLTLLRKTALKYLRAIIGAESTAWEDLRGVEMQYRVIAIDAENNRRRRAAAMESVNDHHHHDNSFPMREAKAAKRNGASTSRGTHHHSAAALQRVALYHYAPAPSAPCSRPSSARQPGTAAGAVGNAYSPGRTSSTAGRVSAASVSSGHPVYAVDTSGVGMRSYDNRGGQYSRSVQGFQRQAAVERRARQQAGPRKEEEEEEEDIMDPTDLQRHEMSRRPTKPEKPNPTKLLAFRRRQHT